MKKEWVVVLGAGKSQLALIKNAKSLGYKVLAIDQNNDSPGFAIADEVINESTYNGEAILKKLRGRKIDGLLARSTGNALYTAADIAEAFNIPGVNSELADISTSKSALRKFAYKNKIRVPDGFKVNNSNEIIKDQLPEVVIVKPDFTVVGKKSISKINTKDLGNLIQAIDSALYSSGNGFAEIDEFIDGYDCSYLTWIEKGEASILLSWDELIGFDKNSFLFQYGVSMPSISTQVNHYEEIEKFITSFTSLFPSLCSLVSFSFRVDQKGMPWLIELHADMTGDSILDKLAPLSTNIDYLLEITKLFIEAQPSRFDLIENKIAQSPAAILYSKNSKTLKDDILLKKENLKELFDAICSFKGISYLDQKKFIDI